MQKKNHNKKKDPSLDQLRENPQYQHSLKFDISRDGVLRYSGRLCILNFARLRHWIMDKVHNSCYSIHPNWTKMYHDIKKIYLWHEMKKEVAELVEQCPNFQKVKGEHQILVGQVLKIDITLWKWKAIIMDFITWYLDLVASLTLFK